MAERDACKTAALDWELLSKSMALANPNANSNPNPSSAKKGRNPSPKSLFRYPVLDDSRNPNPSPEYVSSLDPFHEDASGDKIVAGHMPQQSAPVHLLMYERGHGYGEDTFPEPDAESLLQADPFMAASQDLAIETAEALLGVSSGAEQAPKKKARRSRSAKVVWTIAVAATIVGIVMLGRRWQAELYQNQQLQLELSIKDEKLDDLTRQVSSLKDVLRRHYTARSSTF